MATVISNSCLAIGTTLANKYALKTIPLPLSLLWIQAILASVVLLVVSKLYPAANISILKPFKVNIRAASSPRLNPPRSDP